MKKLIGLTAVAAAALTFMADPPPLAHAAEIGTGPAEVNLAVCAAGDTQTDTFIPNCSYSYLTKVAAPPYTYLTSQGAVAWKGTATGGALAFPASGQTWPALTNLFLGASRTTTPKDVTGTVDSNGKVDLTLSYDTLIKAGANQCTLTGTVALSSQGTEKLGGQAVGKDYDPATGQFAVVSTTYTAPAATGSCLLINAAYDLSKGMGWYLTGTMTLPTAPPVAQKQTATVNVPKKVKREGKTVLLKTAVVTNAGQTSTAKVTWSTKKNAKGTKAKYASVKITRAGKVTLRTTGKARKLYVKLSLKAPATTGYEAYSYAKKWTVK